MSCTIVCLIAFIAFLIFLYLFTRLYKLTDLSERSYKGKNIPRKTGVILELFKESSDRYERIMLIAAVIPIFLRMGFCGLLAALATGGFTCLATICRGYELLGVLEKTRQIFHEIFVIIKSY